MNSKDRFLVCQAVEYMKLLNIKELRIEGDFIGVTLDETDEDGNYKRVVLELI